MLILGLLILVLAVLFILYVVTGADGSTTLEALSVKTTMPVSTLFFSGMAALAALGLGLWLIGLGLRAGAKRRKREKELEREAREARGHREPVDGAARPGERDRTAPTPHDERDRGPVATDPVAGDERVAGDPRIDGHRSDDGPREHRVGNGLFSREERTDRSTSPRYEDHQEERPLRSGEPLRDETRGDEDPYPRR
ncbi:hypothetical protein [Kytococcus sedentarius]|uniref:hypothetical protein n=1 Tax=Kytococcus sedentarius TaxID=1276 RepID=UPI0035BC51D0